MTSGKTKCLSVFVFTQRNQLANEPKRVPNHCLEKRQVRKHLNKKHVVFKSVRPLEYYPSGLNKLTLEIFEHTWRTDELL